MILTAKIVGELACQQNSYLRDLQTTVVSCVEVHAAKADTKRTKKNKDRNTLAAPSESAFSAVKLWEIECADSVLFPEGGGQPTDHGTLTKLEEPHEPIPVTTVHRDGLRAVIFSPHPLVPGTVITQRVDDRRRMDHMQQHTGQHLLSAVMDTYPGLETLGWSMGSSIFSNGTVDANATVNMNYVELGRKPTDAEITEIQNRCNELIRQNRSITVSTPIDAHHDSLPSDYDKEKGIVRVITIDGIDSNPCCGTHLSQTSHIGSILLHHTQPIRGTNTRLFFTCGDRALSLANSAIRATRTVAAILSSGTTPTELGTRATQVTTSLRDALRAGRKLETEIAGYIAANVIQNKLTWVYRADAGLEFLMDVVAAIPPTELPSVLVLATGACPEGGSVLIVGSDSERVQNTASKAAQSIKGLKGGGKGARWQGKVQTWDKKSLGELEKISKANENGA
ncbi:alanyl-tRNA synthetase [Ceratobasidium sp. AG-Ba]|nr:alanyl-tRNA synthetase [Ceratobasidium sp. AG-Ba]